MKKTFAPLVLAATLAMGAATASSAMTQELNAMTGALVNALTTMSIQPQNVGDLTLAEINKINLILNSGDSISDQRSKIQSILNK